MQPFSLDELSQLSPEQAVANRFDVSNLNKARWFLVLYALAAAGGTIAASIGDPRRLAILVPNLLFAVVFFFALRRWRLRYCRNALRGWRRSRSYGWRLPGRWRQRRTSGCRW